MVTLPSSLTSPGSTARSPLKLATDALSIVTVIRSASMIGFARVMR
jgi:hypothetical protein